MKPEFITYPDRELLILSLADRISSQLGHQVRTSGRAVLCVAGGSTPLPVLDALSPADLDWSAVQVVLSDDRWVADDDKRSNAGMIRRHLLQGRASAASYLDLFMPDTDPATAAPMRSEQVAAMLPLTVALLGMGTDMHAASLFPGDPALDAALAPDAPEVVATGTPDDPRITLSARVLNGAIHKHLLILGADKQAAYERALSLSPQQAPVVALFNDLTVHWAE